LERVRYGGAEPAQDFGERLFLKGEAQLGLTRAKHLLLVGDGADWVEVLAGHNRPGQDLRLASHLPARLVASHPCLPPHLS